MAQCDDGYRDRQKTVRNQVSAIFDQLGVCSRG